jgi:ubiquitin carboxyl-terminal hydrolase 34
MSSCDYVADLRAEVVTWWENSVVVTKKSNSSSSTTEKSTTTPVLGSLLSLSEGGIGGPIRMITQGIELSPDFDEKTLAEIPLKDLQVIQR